MPPLSILLKPASSGCNLRCAYCFYADEAKVRAVPNYGRMPETVSHALIEKAAEAAEGSVAFLFQGGEPTLAGLDFYQDFVSYVKKNGSSRLGGTLRHPDQRNAAGPGVVPFFQREPVSGGPVPGRQPGVPRPFPSGRGGKGNL